MLGGGAATPTPPDSSAGGSVTSRDADLFDDDDTKVDDIETRRDSKDDDTNVGRGGVEIDAGFVTGHDSSGVESAGFATGHDSSGIESEREGIDAPQVRFTAPFDSPAGVMRRAPRRRQNRRPPTVPITPSIDMFDAVAGLTTRQRENLPVERQTLVVLSHWLSARLSARSHAAAVDPWQTLGAMDSATRGEALTSADREYINTWL